ncbi:MAG: excinuclease ABC subunit UvrA [Aureliella sp.]
MKTPVATQESHRSQFDLHASAADDVIRLRGVRTHNLKNIHLDLPHDRLTVITGVSGSGKSSLAFDTIFAEGQRQYIDSLSVYARQFIDQMQRPDVDLIEGLQPTLCIDQRSAAANPRSTVGTITEVYDYLRLFMSKLGTPHCFACGQPIVQQSAEQIQAALMALPEATRLVIMAPIVRGRPGAHREVFAEIRKAGLVKVRVDDELYDIEEVPDLAVRKKHSIEAVVDKIVLRSGSSERVAAAVRLALTLADGLVSVSSLPGAVAAAGGNGNRWDERLFSTRYACAHCGVSYEELEPRTFSFNSPYGACPTCGGVGTLPQFDPDSLVIDWDRAPSQGAILPWHTAPTKIKRQLRKSFESMLEALGGAWDQPLSVLKTAARRKLLVGEKKAGTKGDDAALGSAAQGGLVGELSKVLKSAESHEDDALIAWLDGFRQSLPCAACGGSRLRPEALSVTIDDHNIYEVCSKSVQEALLWLESYQPDPTLLPIAGPIIKPMLHRLRFLSKVGVGYLALERGADTLSGGELQRVRLATSIGSGLVGVCYVLDEPSIGLHQRDNDRLIQSLRDLQSQGNTVIVVEHDEAMMRAADVLVDVGPGAGNRGGEIVAVGTPEEVEADRNSLTAAYLRGERTVTLDRPRRSADQANWLELSGARLHNLKNVSLRIPLGMLVGITGVSGSGKSSLVSETLAPALARTLGLSGRKPGPFRALTGTEHVDKLIEITQASIGRTPRSTPATYCGVFDLIRTVFASTNTAKQRGFSASRFSFNTGSGRCAQCLGQGQEKIEMNFLADMYVTCSVCGGSRYNRQTLQVRYRDKTIADVLAMSVDEATEFFENFSKIHRLLDSLQKVGLGYLSLGQSSTTLSGGEAQRIKLAAELARAETGRTVYFLDEPTTGLHFEDCRRLLGVLDGLVARGNTVIVIEHNLDVIAACDWLVDLGPDGGADGGEIVACGAPEEIAACPQSLTGVHLQKMFERH